MEYEKTINDLNRKYNKEVQKKDHEESDLTLDEMVEFAKIVYSEGTSDRYLSYLPLEISIVTIGISVLSISNVSKIALIIFGVIISALSFLILIFSIISIVHRRKLREIKKAVFIKKNMQEKYEKRR